MGAVQTAIQTRRLRFAQSLELVETLATELEQFRVKVTLSRNEIYEAWRERDHDDLVLALALAVWYGGRYMRVGEPVVYPPDARRLKGGEIWRRAC